MCFYGNPGTGKTEVARILSRILYDASVLDEAKLIETDALGLLGKFVGETAPKTLQKVNEAMGGVLFIDEAYALTNGTQQDGVNSSYGEEAIAVLLREMENHIVDMNLEVEETMALNVERSNSTNHNLTN